MILEGKGKASFVEDSEFRVDDKEKTVMCFKQGSDIVRFAFEKDYLSCSLEN